VLPNGGMDGRAIQFSGEFGVTVATVAAGTARTTLGNYFAGDLREAAPCDEGVVHGHGHDHWLRR
jgi:hypothetical protein